MGTGRPRSFACALIALALLAALAPATVPAAKGKGKRAFPFGARVLKPGTKGKDVRFLQRALTRLGVPTGVDGAFGKRTRTSVMTFETQRGWQVNGIVSRKEAKKIRKLLARGSVAPGYFIAGYVSPTLTLTSNKRGSTQVRILDGGGVVVQTIGVEFGGAETRTVSWNGITPAGIAPDGTYLMKLSDPGTAGATVTGGQTQPFGMHMRAFPVPGNHDYGGAGSRFGAPRSSHIHQGQDLAAACGERLYVVETGVVSVNAYQASGAGYYVVIHGTLSGSDFVYMHLKHASWAPAGTSVYAGQQIGKVGSTGSSTGCHLHFERWTAPGWYVGGYAYDPLPELQYWDSYS